MVNRALYVGYTEYISRVGGVDYTQSIHLEYNYTYFVKIIIVFVMHQ